jgi:hypothetical protein
MILKKIAKVYKLKERLWKIYYMKNTLDHGAATFV